ncbi:acyltransferase [Acidithiobacillus ferrooxidans]|uniref:acyltransferase n=1 Tax=Acidithiobacillus ferrooxidans TaxID=920 RepID=UPI001C0717E5|nr:acyltransferase [Acidithiobacillus ferrooxidans]MBU2774314.1 acyltransferase [Acidithiobacillus ferrooxidans]
MLNDVRYLWRKLEKPTSPRRWIKVWVKRCYHIVNLYRLLMRSTLFLWRGASVGRLVVLGRARIEERATLLSIGEEASLGRCKIALYDRVTIGRRVVVSDGVVLLTATHSLNDPDRSDKKASIVIGDYAWVATNAMVLPGVIIGRGAVVGAGAAFRRNVPDYAIVTGNPATTRPIQQNAELQYSSVLLNAPLEAWVGPDPCVLP